MKLFALLFAFLTVACAIDALVLPAIAQQTVRSIPPSAMKGVSAPAAPAATNAELEAKQTTATDGIGEERDYALTPETAPAADEERPPPVRFIWGGQGRGAAPSVVDSVAEKYTMFSTDGAMRAAAEADVSSKSKSGDGASVQGPTAMDQQTYRPSEFRIAPDNDDGEDDDSD